MRERIADWDDLPHTEWMCEHCHSTNSCLDADCQFCDGNRIQNQYTLDHTAAEEEALEAGRSFMSVPPTPLRSASIEVPAQYGNTEGGKHD